VIEFALLFALGFMTAAFLVFLIAPAVHRRIVWFTEKRLKATMPLSPQEVRAQKDMARARYAAENAKTEQVLAQEREKTIALTLRQNELTRKAGELAIENATLQAQIDEMNVEAGDLRSRLRREETYISQLKSSLKTVEHTAGEKDGDIDTMRKRLTKFMSDVDNMKIDLATRDTEVESTRARANALRDERDALRQEVNLLIKRAKDAEMRLEQELSRALRLEDQLGREIAGNADKETIIERRTRDVTRLKEKLKSANAEARDVGRTLRAAGLTPANPVNDGKMPAAEAALPNADQEENATMTAKQAPDTETEIVALADDVRNRATALSDRVLNVRSPAHDQAVRDEIATVAAAMVALTALREGEASPIAAILAEEGKAANAGRLSLAERARELISDKTAG
jgi:chromosome segregation ATPase